jgi:hypothetical protein
MSTGVNEWLRLGSLWAGCSALGFSFGKSATHLIGEHWAPPGAEAFAWLCARLIAPDSSSAERAGLLLLVYGTGLLGGILAGGLAALLIRHGFRAPVPLIAGTAPLCHSLMFSPIHQVIGWPTMLTLTIASTAAAALFGFFLAHVVRPVPTTPSSA